MTHRICFILRSHPVVSLGGAELQAIYIAEEFVRRGWEVHYISELKGKVPPAVPSNGVTPHWIKRRATGSGLLNFFALSKLLKQIRPDVIYQRAATDYTGIVGLLARLRGTRYVWAASSDNDCQTAKLGLRVAHYKHPIKKLLQAAKFACADSLISYGLRTADLVIVQSADQQRLLSKHFARPSILVKNGFPIREVHDAKTATPSVIWVGNIKRVKRVDLFLQLVAACHNSPIRFIVIGKDDKNGSLRKYLANHKTDNLDYLGALDVTRTEQYIASAHLLVNTSDYEGFPNTFIQAWMRRTPVVSLNVDPDGVIKKHQLGCHSETFPQLVSDVASLLANTPLCQQMADNAYRYIVKEHNIQKTVDCLETLIASPKSTRMSDALQSAN